MKTPHSSWAHLYDFAYRRSFGAFYDLLTETTVDLVREKVGIPAKVVDFGAGTGRLSIPLSRLGYEVVAVDPCAEMLQQLKLKDPASAIRLHQSRMEDFPGDGSCDLALCVFTVLLYLLDGHSLNASFDAAGRALKTGGFLLVDVPARGLFTGYSRSDELMDRQVTVTEITPGIFGYRETITVKNSGGQSTCVDEFQIRHWSMEEVMKALRHAGFHPVDDCSFRFAGSGSSYFLWKKR